MPGLIIHKLCKGFPPLFKGFPPLFANLTPFPRLFLCRPKQHEASDSLFVPVKILTPEIRLSAELLSETQQPVVVAVPMVAGWVVDGAAV